MKHWKELLDEMYEGFKEYEEKTGVVVKILQVKEKYGSLRVYLESHDKLLDAIIYKAVDKSTKICWDCGSREDVELDTRGWWTYRCKECMDEPVEKEHKFLTRVEAKAKEKEHRRMEDSAPWLNWIGRWTKRNDK